jgi:hypothetical protein
MPQRFPVFLVLGILISASAPPVKAAPAATTAQAQSAPASTAETEPVRRATPVELKRLADTVDFQHGRFMREALGLRLDIPRGQHLLAGTDARDADTALRGENDPLLIGWMIDENKTLTDANLRIARLRWLHDGLIALPPAALDSAALLDTAHSRPLMARIFSSGGTLIRYVTPPLRDGSLVTWSEERQPIDATKARAYDCHALRLARKGVLEISIAGVDAKAAKTCVGELETLAATIQFEAASDYPAQPGDERLAPYSLDALIAQTQ